LEVAPDFGLMLALHCIHHDFHPKSAFACHFPVFWQTHQNSPFFFHFLDEMGGEVGVSGPLQGAIKGIVFVKTTEMVFVHL